MHVCVLLWLSLPQCIATFLFDFGFVYTENSEASLPPPYLPSYDEIPHVSSHMHLQRYNDQVAITEQYIINYSYIVYLCNHVFVHAGNDKFMAIFSGNRDTSV